MSSKEAMIAEMKRQRMDDTYGPSADYLKGFTEGWQAATKAMLEFAKSMQQEQPVKWNSNSTVVELFDAVCVSDLERWANES